MINIGMPEKIIEQVADILNDDHTIRSVMAAEVKALALAAIKAREEQGDIEI